MASSALASFSLASFTVGEFSVGEFFALASSALMSFFVGEFCHWRVSPLARAVFVKREESFGSPAVRPKAGKRGAYFGSTDMTAGDRIAFRGRESSLNHSSSHNRSQSLEQNGIHSPSSSRSSSSNSYVNSIINGVVGGGHGNSEVSKTCLRKSTQPMFRISGDLTPQQIHIVKRTWKQVMKSAEEDEQEIAVRLLLRIFQLDPRNQAYFLLGGVAFNDLRQHPCFFSTKYLQTLGGRHVLTGVTYKSAYWKTFVQALIDVVEADTAEVFDAYTVLGAFCVEQMRIGYKIEYMLQREAERLSRQQQRNGFIKKHTYLRISLTERCNLRCTYCMPEEGVQLTPNQKLLTTPEIVRLARLFAFHGVDKVRLTGGEPTLRKDLVEIVDSIAKIDGIKDVGLTSNGIVLGKKLDALLEAGLTQLNVSLDTLDEAKYMVMSRRNGFNKVMQLISKATSSLKNHVKINCVVIRGINDDEICDFVAMTHDQSLDIRFIEYMPFGATVLLSTKCTSKAYKIEGFKGQFGFITSMSQHFCNTCNRLRITADGNLKVCLHGNAEVSLRDKMRSGIDDDQLSTIISEAISRKKLNMLASKIW
uniref:GTP 3',8-cyclase n=1 Tax=Ditylenchus dipsaci TaxID=166011 RepID=A0A915E542_9BILA